MINQLLKKSTIKLIYNLLQEGKTQDDVYDYINEQFIFQKNVVADKQLFGYMGGKGRVSKQLLPYIPDNQVYIEPFFGSGALFFAKGYKDLSCSDGYREVINDLDSNVVNFYEILRSKTQELIDFVDNVEYSEELSKKVNTTSEYYKSCNDVERAGFFFFNILSSFGMNINHGFAYSMKGSNNCITFLNKTLLLKAFAERIKKAFIFNKPYNEILDIFDCNTMHKGKKHISFSYLDPPYINTAKYQVQKENQFDYDFFVKRVKEIKGYFMLSHYKSDWLLKNFPQNEYYYVDIEHAISICKSNGEERKGKHDNQEVIIMNYDINNINVDYCIDLFK